MMDAEVMDNEQQPGRPKVRTIKRPKRLVSRTRVIMLLLLLVAIPIFIALCEQDRARERRGDPTDVRPVAPRGRTA